MLLSTNSLHISPPVPALCCFECRSGLKLRVRALKKERYFRGSELVGFLSKLVRGPEAETWATKTCQQLLEKGYLSRLKGEAHLPFVGDSTAYRFNVRVRLSYLSEVWRDKTRE
jgi:hypothetical protein